MTFQIHALDPAPFAPLFELTDSELALKRACRMTVTESPGTPCRVTLDDAEIGETVILTNYTHLPASSPYHASHAIFIRRDKERAAPAPGEVPAMFFRRPISLRALDVNGMIVDASVVHGPGVAPALNQMLAQADVEDIHLHFAAPGCFAARATRV